MCTVEQMCSIFKGQTQCLLILHVGKLRIHDSKWHLGKHKSSRDQQNVSLVFEFLHSNLWLQDSCAEDEYGSNPASFIVNI